MIRLLLFLNVSLLLACSTPSTEEELTEENKEPIPAETGYNEALAKELGADQFGMKAYVLAFLKSGPNRSQDSVEAARLQKAHLENIGRMAEAGKLVLAGPFMDEGDIRGIYIFNVSTVEEAKALTETDPAVQAGRLVMELHPWYGSAALMQVNEIGKTLAQKSVAD